MIERNWKKKRAVEEENSDGSYRWQDMLGLTNHGVVVIISWVSNSISQNQMFKQEWKKCSESSGKNKIFFDFDPWNPETTPRTQYIAFTSIFRPSLHPRLPDNSKWMALEEGDKKREKVTPFYSLKLLNYPSFNVVVPYDCTLDSSRP